MEFIGRMYIPIDDYTVQCTVVVKGIMYTQLYCTILYKSIQFTIHNNKYLSVIYIIVIFGVNYFRLSKIKFGNVLNITK